MSVTSPEVVEGTGTTSFVRAWGPFVAAGLVAGILSELFGIGGGLIIVPMLVMLFHFKQKIAQGTSLTAIVIIAIAGAVPYVLHEHIDWLAAALIVVGGVTGSFIGSAIVHHLNDDWLRVIFAVVVVASAAKMFFAVSSSGGAASVSPAHSAAIAGAYLLAGLAMGTLSSLVGVGGGIILVPMLAIFLGLAQPEAQGLSLVVMAPVSIVGAVRNGRNGYINLPAGIAIGIGGAIMSPLAALLALHMPIKALSYLFGALLLFTAGQLVYKVVQSRREARAQQVLSQPEV